jgi:HSP20 family protein
MSNLMLTPFREMLTLREAMDRLFDESFVRGPASANGYGLALDVQMDKDDYIVRANVPGLKPEDLHIEVVDNTITVSGEIKSERQEKQDNYLLQERRYGQFSRSVSLPTAVNSAKAEATIEHGVLTLRVPKAEEAKPKAITIKAK